MSDIRGIEKNIKEIKRLLEKLINILGEIKDGLGSRS